MPALPLGASFVEHHFSAESAADAACEWIHDGYDVYEVGSDEAGSSVAPDRIAQIYRRWLHDKYPRDLRRRHQGLQPASGADGPNLARRRLCSADTPAYWLEETS